MTINSIEIQRIERLNACLQNISQLDREAVLGTEFGEFSSDIDRSISLFSALSLCKFEKITGDRLLELIQLAEKFHNHLQSMKRYNLGEREDGVDGNSLQANCNHLGKLIYDQVGMQLAVCFAFGKDLNSSLIDLTAAISKLKTESESTLQNLIEKTKKDQKTVEDMLAKTVVAKHAGNFNSEAKHHRNISFAWLSAAIVIGVSIYLYVDFEIANMLRSAVPIVGPSLPPSIWIQLSISKFVIVSLLSYLLFFTLRNFTAHRHNHTVNVHRRNALSTFETFAAASDDPQTKQALLLQAAEAIFKPQITGYIKDEPEPSHSSQIVEIFRGLSNQQK